AAGGLLYGVSALTAYGTALVLMSGAALLALAIPKPPRRGSPAATTLETLFAGFRYVWSQKVILGAISLDLFAVLLGGAVALLPIFARDILHAGPLGLGLFRTAPAVGAAIVAVGLAHHPLRKNARSRDACVRIQ